MAAPSRSSPSSPPATFPDDVVLLRAGADDRPAFVQRGTERFSADLGGLARAGGSVRRAASRPARQGACRRGYRLMPAPPSSSAGCAIRRRRVRAVGRAKKSARRIFRGVSAAAAWPGTCRISLCDRRRWRSWRPLSRLPASPRWLSKRSPPRCRAASSFSKLAWCRRWPSRFRREPRLTPIRRDGWA